MHIINDILPVPSVKLIGIAAFATGQDIRPRAASKPIIATITVKPVVPGHTNKRVMIVTRLNLAAGLCRRVRLRSINHHCRSNNRFRVPDGAVGEGNLRQGPVLGGKIVDNDDAIRAVPHGDNQMVFLARERDLIRTDRVAKAQGIQPDIA